jgi:uncharacterized membrane protein
VEILYPVFKWLELLIDVSAALIMAAAFFAALFAYLRITFGSEPSRRFMLLQQVRCSLGVKLVFALELLIISDLLRTIVSKSMDDMLIVGALVVIRTIIAYFLNQEVDKVSAELARDRES